MVLVLKRQKLAYFPIRKIATTTIVDALKSTCDSEKDYTETFSLPMSARSRRLSRGCFRFVVIRDPVSRILSGYGNRVVYHNDLTDSALDRAILAAFRLNPRPDINEFCLRIRAYRLANDKIRRHSQLQVKSLGSDLGFFDAIYPFEDFAAIEKELSQRIGKPLTFKRLQTGGPKIKFGDLTPEAQKALLDYTEPDYRLLSDYYKAPRISA